MKQLWASARKRVLDALRRWGWLKPVNPNAYIQSILFSDSVLEGTVIKRLVVPAGSTVEIKGPIKEPIFNNRVRPPRMDVLEWDALKVAEDMVHQWAMSLGDHQTMIYRVPEKERPELIRNIVKACGLRAYR